MKIDPKPLPAYARRARYESWLDTGFGISVLDTWSVLWGMLLPLAFLLIAAFYNPTDWARGEALPAGVLIHKWPHLVLQYPLVVFSAVGMGVWVFAEEEHRCRPWVAFALAGGAVLWLELLSVWVSALSAGRLVQVIWPLILVALSPLAGLVMTLPYAAIAYSAGGSARSGEPGLRALAGLLGFMAIVLTLPLFYVWVMAIVLATPLAALTYSVATWRWLTEGRGERRISLRQLMLAGAWLSWNLAAWRWAATSMLRP